MFKEMDGTHQPIDGTIAALSAIVDETCAEGSSNGIFAAMYRTVTVRTRDATRDGGFFDDDPRMANLAVVFADRYLDAYRRYRDSGNPTESWRMAFEVGDAPARRMILQHLLLGMNAHINLDLGIATAQVAPGDRLRPMYRDFLRINEVLFQMIDGLQDGLSEVSPRLQLVDRLGGRWDESFMRFSIRTGRDLAWRLAERLAAVEPREQRAEISERDRETVLVARTIVRPWSPINVVGRAVAASEPRDVGEVIDALGGLTVDLDEVQAAVRVEATRGIAPDRPLTEAGRRSRFRRR
jgi:hypothetical protein